MSDDQRPADRVTVGKTVMLDHDGNIVEAPPHRARSCSAGSPRSTATSWCSPMMTRPSGELTARARASTLPDCGARGVSPVAPTPPLRARSFPPWLRALSTSRG